MTLRTSLAFAAAIIIPAAIFADSPAPDAQNTEAAAAPKSASAATTIEAAETRVAEFGDKLRDKIELHKTNKTKLDFAWNNEEFSSPAVVEKRKEIRELQASIIKAQKELRDEVAKLPEVQKLVEENEKLDAEIKTMRVEFNALISNLRKAQAAPRLRAPAEEN
jgi:hypothetical protein